jgi:nucleoside-diphosphate-sugar epimerase
VALEVLLIGGTGPTGPHVVEGLRRRGARVTVLHRGTHELPELDDLEHIHIDPHDAAALGQALDGRRFDVAVVMYGRLKAVADILAGKTGYVIAIGGTNYALGDHQWLAEGHPYRATQAGEKMLEAERTLFQVAKKGAYGATLLRYANVYGPRQIAPREWSLVRRFRDGRKRFLLCDSGITLETRIFARNGAAAVLAAFDNPQKAAGQDYNVADDYPLTDRERLAVIAGVAGVRDYEVVSMPTALARPAWHWSVGRNGNKPGEVPEVGHRLLSTEKIRRELGYRAVAAPEDGLRETARFYLDNPPEPGGLIEQKLGDPFDYEGEDRYFAAWDRLAAELGKVELRPLASHYGYRLPPKP